MSDYSKNRVLANERELEDALVEQIAQFLLELRTVFYG